MSEQISKPDYRRVTEWRPAYNRTAEGYGRHGMDLRFVLVGPKGAVQFLLFTAFYHSTDRDAYKYEGGILGVDGRRHDIGVHSMASGADLGYHALAPQYEDQSPMDCEYVDGGKCYYDGSGLNAEDAFDVFTDEGEEALWKLLERYYAATFDGGEFPQEIGRRWNRRLEYAR